MVVYTQVDAVGKALQRGAEQGRVPHVDRDDKVRFELRFQNALATG